MNGEGEGKGLGNHWQMVGINLEIVGSYYWDF